MTDLPRFSRLNTFASSRNIAMLLTSRHAGSIPNSITKINGAVLCRLAVRASLRRFDTHRKICPVPQKLAALVPRLRTGTAAAHEGENPEWRGYTSQAMFRARGTHTPSLGTLLSPPDVVRPRGRLPLELRPKTWLPLERAVRGMAPDTRIGKGRAALKIPAQGSAALGCSYPSSHRAYPLHWPFAAQWNGVPTG